MRKHSITCIFLFLGGQRSNIYSPFTSKMCQFLRNWETMYVKVAPSIVQQLYNKLCQHVFGRRFLLQFPPITNIFAAQYSVYRTIIVCDKWISVWYGLLLHEAKPSVISAHITHLFTYHTRWRAVYSLYHKNCPMQPLKCWFCQNIFHAIQWNIFAVW